jgi:hypothetical protein
MSATTKVAAAVAAGYLLGRTKKLRLAITVGSVLAGGRLAGGVKPGTLVQMLSDNPEVQRLQEQLRGQVLEAAKTAAANVAASRLESLNESLQGGKSLTQTLTGEGEEAQDAGQPEQDQPDQQSDQRQGDQQQGEQQQSDQQGDQDQQSDQERPAAKKAAARKRTQGGAQGAARSTAQGAAQGAAQGTAKRASAAKRAPRKKAAASGEGR